MTAQRIVDLLHAAKPRCGRTVVVGIDGPSGSGKTTLAEQVRRAVQAQLARSVPVIHMDDLFPGWDGLAVAPGLLTEQVLEPLARGEHARYRRWDWHREAWGATRELPWTDLLVVEGCASTVAPAAPYISVPVWVEADPAVRMRRGIERDGEAFRPHWERWAAQEREVFAADGTRGRAVLTLDTTE